MLKPQVPTVFRSSSQEEVSSRPNTVNGPSSTLRPHTRYPHQYHAAKNQPSKKGKLFSTSAKEDAPTMATQSLSATENKNNKKPPPTKSSLLLLLPAGASTASARHPPLSYHWVPPTNTKTTKTQKFMSVEGAEGEGKEMDDPSQPPFSVCSVVYDRQYFQSLSWSGGSTAQRRFFTHQQHQNENGEGRERKGSIHSISTDLVTSVPHILAGGRSSHSGEDVGVQKKQGMKMSVSSSSDQVAYEKKEEEEPSAVENAAANSEVLIPSLDVHRAHDAIHDGEPVCIYPSSNHPSGSATANNVLANIDGTMTKTHGRHFSTTMTTKKSQSSPRNLCSSSYSSPRRGREDFLVVTDPEINLAPARQFIRSKPSTARTTTELNKNLSEKVLWSFESLQHLEQQGKKEKSLRMGRKNLRKKEKDAEEETLEATCSSSPSSEKEETRLISAGEIDDEQKAEKKVGATSPSGASSIAPSISSCSIIREQQRPQAKESLFSSSNQPELSIIHSEPQHHQEGENAVSKYNKESSLDEDHHRSHRHRPTFSPDVVHEGTTTFGYLMCMDPKLVQFLRDDEDREYWETILEEGGVPALSQLASMVQEASAEKEKIRKGLPLSDQEEMLDPKLRASMEKYKGVYDIPSPSSTVTPAPLAQHSHNNYNKKEKDILGSKMFPSVKDQLGTASSVSTMMMKSSTQTGDGEQQKVTHIPVRTPTKIDPHSMKPRPNAEQLLQEKSKLEKKIEEEKASRVQRDDQSFLEHLMKPTKSTGAKQDIKVQLRRHEEEEEEEDATGGGKKQVGEGGLHHKNQRQKKNGENPLLLSSSSNFESSISKKLRKNNSPTMLQEILRAQAPGDLFGMDFGKERGDMRRMIEQKLLFLSENQDLRSEFSWRCSSHRREKMDALEEALSVRRMENARKLKARMATLQMAKQHQLETSGGTSNGFGGDCHIITSETDARIVRARERRVEERTQHVMNCPSTLCIPKAPLRLPANPCSFVKKSPRLDCLASSGLNLNQEGGDSLRIRRLLVMIHLSWSLHIFGTSFVHFRFRWHRTLRSAPLSEILTYGTNFLEQEQRVRAVAKIERNLFWYSLMRRVRQKRNSTVTLRRFLLVRKNVQKIRQRIRYLRSDTITLQNFCRTYMSNRLQRLMNWRISWQRANEQCNDQLGNDVVVPEHCITARLKKLHIQMTHQWFDKYREWLRHLRTHVAQLKAKLQRLENNEKVVGQGQQQDGKNSTDVQSTSSSSISLEQHATNLLKLNPQPEFKQEIAAMDLSLAVTEERALSYNRQTDEQQRQETKSSKDNTPERETPDGQGKNQQGHHHHAIEESTSSSSRSSVCNNDGTGGMARRYSRVTTGASSDPPLHSSALLGEYITEPTAVSKRSRRASVVFTTDK